MGVAALKVANDGFEKQLAKFKELQAAQMAILNELRCRLDSLEMPTMSQQAQILGRACHSLGVRPPCLQETSLLEATDMQVVDLQGLQLQSTLVDQQQLLGRLQHEFAELRHGMANMQLTLVREPDVDTSAHDRQYVNPQRCPSQAIYSFGDSIQVDTNI